jgi:hypothetical protein
LTVPDSTQQERLRKLYEDRCKELKSSSFNVDENNTASCVSKFLEWLENKCLMHQGERTLLYHYSVCGAIVMRKQYDILSRYCSDLDDGLFTELLPGAREEMILERAKKLRILPDCPLDDLIDKRVWKFFPKLKKDDVETSNEMLTNYRNFLQNFLDLSPHTSHKLQEFNQQIAGIQTKVDHHNFWVEGTLTSQSKRNKCFSEMASGEFKYHTLQAMPGTMDIPNTDLLQFELIFCTNSLALMEMQKYSCGKDASTKHFFFDRSKKCKKCFQNAIQTATLLHQEFSKMFMTLVAELSQFKSINGLSKKNNGSAKRCLAFLKFMFDEILPAAVIRYLWGRKSLKISDTMAQLIEDMKPLSPAQFTWVSHECAANSPPTIISLICHLRDIICKKVSCSDHMDSFLNMFQALHLGLFDGSTNETAHGKIDAVITFFDHITTYAELNYSKKRKELLPKSMEKKLWPTKKPKGKDELESSDHSDELGDSSSSASSCKTGSHGRHHDVPPDTSGKVMDMQLPKRHKESQDIACCNDKDFGDAEEGSNGTECEEDDDDDDNDDDDDDDDNDNDDDDGPEHGNENDGVGCDTVQGNYGAGIEMDDDGTVTKKTPPRQQELQQQGTSKEQNAAIDISSGSEDEALDFIGFKEAMDLAMQHGGESFATEFARFITKIAPFSGYGVISFKVTGGDVERYGQEISRACQSNETSIQQDHNISTVSNSSPALLVKADGSKKKRTAHGNLSTPVKRSKLIKGAHVSPKTMNLLTTPKKH